MTEREIEHAAADILLAHDVDFVPVDPFVIARAEGIRLLPGNYDDCFDGRIEFRQRGDRQQFFLFYPEARPPWRPPGRVRFSLAHELAHYFLPEHRAYLLAGDKHGSQSGFLSAKPSEREADQFAAALLLPEKQFSARVEWKRGGFCTLRDLLQLANVFQTSVTATVIRYVRLNYEPCCVVLSERGHIAYSRSADDMARMGLAKPSEITVPTGSVTSRMLRLPIAEAVTATISEGNVDADIWFASGYSRQLWEEAMILGRTGVALTFLALDQDRRDSD